ncbi:dTMP kinase [Nematocida displodere]|uniref:dTMP kinase n=1 Tax=Nematocida displodere TaxID=1805483 RepID=A0A177ECS6_9MICR|nr:dTMP kinase [Nematocida displodere]
MPKSLFVVIEGIDRSGKTTLARALQASLAERGIEVKHLRYPHRESTTGETIDRALKGGKKLSKEALHLLFAANRWEDSESLSSFLADENSSCTPSSSRIVLCDRYILSGASYSIANGLPEDFALAADKGLRAPDLTLFLDVSPESTAARGGFGDEIYERVDFQWKVYREMKNLLPGYTHAIIPTTDPKTTHATALALIVPLLE